MISEDVVYEGLKDIFADVFMRDDIALAPSLTAKDVAGWDSFKQLEIIMAAEQRFGIRFTTTEIGRFRSLGDLVASVVRHSS